MKRQKKPDRFQPKVVSAPPAPPTEPAPKGRPRRPRQEALEGLGAKQVKEVDDAAEAFVDIRDRRIKLHFEEAKAHERLVEAMRTNGLEKYRDDSAVPPLIVDLTSKTRAKVKREKPKTESDDKGKGGGGSAEDDAF